MKAKLDVAYIAGVILGDGYCSALTLGLRVKDFDFALAFSTSLLNLSGRSCPPRSEGRYWNVRTSNRTRIFDWLLKFEPRDNRELTAWLRGLFDSEGNAHLSLKRGKGNNCYNRRISMYSTTITTLRRASAYLVRLGIRAKIRGTRNSKGHKGTKLVYELVLIGSQRNYSLFAKTVSSSIARKRNVLDAIPRSYVEDLSASCRRSQLRGAATKRERTLRLVLPGVVASIKALIVNGERSSMSRCYRIPGYHTIIGHYFKHSELVQMAQ